MLLVTFGACQVVHIKGLVSVASILLLCYLSFCLVKIARADKEVKSLGKFCSSEFSFSFLFVVVSDYK